MKEPAKKTQRNRAKECPKCNRWVRSDRMKAHLKSRNCKPEVVALTMQRDVYRELKHILERTAIKRIGHELMWRIPGTKRAKSGTLRAHPGTKRAKSVPGTDRAQNGHESGTE